MRYIERVLGCAIVAVWLAGAWGCGNDTVAVSGSPSPTAVSTSTATAVPTATFVPTATSVPASSTPTATVADTPTATPQPTILAYWDTNEEEDALLPDGRIEKLIPPYDPNGQMCIFRDGSGRFVTGYNPTLPSQNNPGSLLPYKNPPVGLAVWDKNGNFTGQTLYVPGPYALPGSDIGGDIPPDNSSTFCTNGTTKVHCTTDADCGTGYCSGTFNNNGTFTGCAIDSKGNVFGADIGSAQGSTASPDQGRIIEWFAPDYKTYCIVEGPTEGGDGPHHVNGTGGLRNPGIMAVDANDNLYIPESGAGRVIEIAHDALPSSAQDCDANGLLQPNAPYTTFISGGGLIPAGIARDPSCNCWAVSNILSGVSGGPAIQWYDDNGMPSSAKGPLPAGGYSPFGVAVSSTGDVFFVDIALTCSGSGCGPTDGAGGIYKVPYTDGVLGTPEKILGSLNFPVSITVCDASKQVCPVPTSNQFVTPQTPGGQG